MGQADTPPRAARWTLLAMALAGLGAAPPQDQRYPDRIQAVLKQHCLQCHQGSKPKGELRLDRLAAGFADDATREKWLAVLARVRSGEMPPQGRPRPPQADVQVLVDWIDSSAKAAIEARATEGRVVLRRLNRVEYENTVNDLLGINASLKEQLPADGAANGFDNAGAALHTSSFLMERYLEAADTALNLAIANRPKPPPLVKNRYTMKESHPVRTTSEKVYRFDDDTVICFCSSQWHNVHVSKFYPQDGGLYRFRISASGVQSAGKPVTFRVTAGNTQLTGTSGLVGYYDAPAGEPTTVEFVRYMEPRTTIAILPYGLASAQTVNKVGADIWDGPGLAIHGVEVEGPLHDTWPPESHRRLFGDLAQKPAPIYNQSSRVEVVSNHPISDAERILRRFTRRAFRRTVTDADVAPFVEIVKNRLADNYSFEPAMRAALKGVLMAPEFLFLREIPGQLDDFALASRLSYFLWSTMPDEELLALAERGALTGRATGATGPGDKATGKLGAPRNPPVSPSPSLPHSMSLPTPNRPVLREQVERMLNHPKAAALTTNFVGQWLLLREIDFTEPSHILYPEFDHLLKVSMIRETELFFEELLKNDLSLTNFVASDFTMLNGRLARHYGIPGIEGWEFRKTTLPPGTHRGGLMTMASVLKVTANGTTTSPVVRGAWVLDRILGTPAPPPPEDVPAIDPDIRGATTIREQLARHRADAACASCHAKIDPAGFALESFDCIGGWRDHYRVTGNGESVVIDGRRMAYHKGKKVDPADVLADGTPFNNVDDFKQLLLRDKDQLARALGIKLLTYATGAAPTSADRPQVEAIVARVRDQNYGLRSFIHEIVQSELFRHK